MRIYDIASDCASIRIPSVFSGIPDLKELNDLKQEIREKLINLMGGLPAPVDLDVTILSVELTDTHRRTRLAYSAFGEDRITAYLLEPLNVKTDKECNEPLPAIIALHQTCIEGKDEVCGIRGDRELAYGLELVKRGYIVLAPDEFVAGERMPADSPMYDTAFFYWRNPGWSAMGKMLHDHVQSVNLLVSLPQVDSRRLAVIGHSLGGHNAFFLAAFDERIRAAVSSCGLCSITGDPDVFRWSRKEWFVYFPELRPFFEEGLSPFEFHEVLALIAPRAYFNWSTQGDVIFPHWQGVNALYKGLEEVYGLLGAADRLEFLMGEGAHEFPVSVRNQAYRFLQKMLRVEE